MIQILSKRALFTASCKISMAKFRVKDWLIRSTQTGIKNAYNCNAMIMAKRG